MSKTVEVKITIDLSNHVKNRQEAGNIGENVLTALIRQAMGSEEGLVGNDFDGYTTGLEVTTYDPNNGPEKKVILCQGWDVHDNNERVTY